MNEQQNIQFVLEVKKYPCLYNSSLSSYSRRSETDKAWEEIGKVTNMTGIACKEKWRNLRVVFMRHMKLSKNSASYKKKKPYYLLDIMQFLLPFVKQSIPILEFQSTSSNDTDNMDDSPDLVIDEKEYARENTEEHRDRHSPVAKRKKVAVQEDDKHSTDYSTNRASITNQCRIYSDHVTSFLDSLVPELREMNLQQFKMFKRKVLTMIDDIMDTSNGTDIFPQPTGPAIIVPQNTSTSKTQTNYPDSNVRSPDDNLTFDPPLLEDRKHLKKEPEYYF